MKKQLDYSDTTVLETKKSFRNWYLVLFFALLLAFGFWLANQKTESEILYDQYYTTYPNVIMPSVKGANRQDTKAIAFYEYDNGNYDEAVTLFSKIYSKDLEDYVLFYKGLCFLELNKELIA